MFPKVAQIDTTVHKVILFEMTPKVTNLFGATFVIKFVAKNLQKSPNLVTLIRTYLSCHTLPSQYPPPA